MPSTFTIIFLRYSASEALPSGASENPQLPPMTVVTPNRLDGVAPGVPEDLGVVVGVGVDESGTDHEPVRVDGLGGGLLEGARLGHGDDPAAGDSDVGGAGGRAGTVDQRAIDNQRVEHRRRG